MLLVSLFVKWDQTIYHIIKDQYCSKKAIIACNCIWGTHILVRTQSIGMTNFPLNLFPGYTRYQSYNRKKTILSRDGDTTYIDLHLTSSITSLALHFARLHQIHHQHLHHLLLARSQLQCYRVMLLAIESTHSDEWSWQTLP